MDADRRMRAQMPKNACRSTRGANGKPKPALLSLRVRVQDLAQLQIGALRFEIPGDARRFNAACLRVAIHGHGTKEEGDA